MPGAISNASPIIHLAKIGKLFLLREFFELVTIPSAVYGECSAPGDRREEVAAIKNADWLCVGEVNDTNLVTLLRWELDEGESEAIALALENQADLILLDDADAREKARLYNLKITGTVGILLRAKKEGRLGGSLREILDQLRLTGFWIDDMLKRQLLVEAGEIEES